MSAEVVCPSPLRCIEELLDSVDHHVGTARAAGVARAWLLDLRCSERSLRALAQAREHGVDIRRLLLAGLLLKAGSAWIDGSVADVTMGPLRLSVNSITDIDDALRRSAELDAIVGEESPHTSTLRQRKAALDVITDNVRRSGGDMLTTVPDGSGGLATLRWKATHAFFCATDVPAVHGPVHDSLRPSTGAIGDPALNVLVWLVRGHLAAVGADGGVSSIVELVWAGLQLGDSGGSENAREALRARVYRCLHSKHAAFLERAELVANALRLPFRSS